MGIFLKRRTLFSLFPSYLPKEALNWPFITNLTARPQRCFVSCLVEMDPVVQIRRLLKHSNLLSLFHIYPHFEEELARQLIKNKSSSPRKFCAMFREIYLMGSGEEI